MLNKLFSFLIPRFESDLVLLVPEGLDDEGEIIYGMAFVSSAQQVRESQYAAHVRYLTIFSFCFFFKVTHIYEIEAVFE